MGKCTNAIVGAILSGCAAGCWPAAQPSPEPAHEDVAGSSAVEDLSPSPEERPLDLVPEPAMSVAPQSRMALPEGFPKDIPLYNGATLTSYSQMRAGRGFRLVYRAEAEPAEVFSWYKAALEQTGWSLETAQEAALEAAFTKDARTLQLSLEPGEDGTNCSLSLSRPD